LEEEDQIGKKIARKNVLGEESTPKLSKKTGQNTEHMVDGEKKKHKAWFKSWDWDSIDE